MADLVIAEMAIEWRGDGFFLTLDIDGKRTEAGPFDTQTEAIRAADELKQTALSLGGDEMPLGKVN